MINIVFATDMFDVTSLLSSSPCLHLVISTYTIVEAQKESNKRGELERSPNKRREVAPVWGAQFLAMGFLVYHQRCQLSSHPLMVSCLFFWNLFLLLVVSFRCLGKQGVGRGSCEKRCGDESSKR